MQREPEIKRKTALSYKTEKKTVLRGYDLSDLAEEGYSFCDALFVLFQDRLPTTNEEKMLKYEMGVFLEHSMSPSAVAAIGVSAGRPNLPCAVAASITTFGGVHGPGAAHGYMLNKYIERARREGKSLDEMAKSLTGFISNFSGRSKNTFTPGAKRKGAPMWASMSWDPATPLFPKSVSRPMPPGVWAAFAGASAVRRMPCTI